MGEMMKEAVKNLKWSAIKINSIYNFLEIDAKRIKVYLDSKQEPSSAIILSAL